MAEEKSLYEEIGGMTTISLLVDSFYNKVISDNTIQHFFVGKDMRALKSKQEIFLAYVFGAPFTYDMESLHNSHKGLKIQKEHFDSVVLHLKNTLEEMNVRQDLSSRVLKIATSVESQIVE